MKQENQLVTINLDTTIDDNGELEYNTIKQTGKFFNKNKLDVLIYEETHEDGEIRNLITIRTDNVNIKRSGLITMNQQFILNKKTETYYEHPHGQLHMETHTDSISYESMGTSGEGQLTIVYKVRINGMEERKHMLELTYKENIK